MENTFCLQVDNIVKQFQSKLAVNSVSFTLPYGQILGMLGPNGAGKTTTIRMILNIIAPDKGEIKIFGQKFSEELKNRIAYLPEERGLYRKMKVLDLILYLTELKGIPPQRVRSRALEYLEKFNLQGYEKRKIEELSKGMAQKVQFIATILHNPELIILDEPFSGLDPLNIELVKDLMLEMKKQGKSIIFSTHLMEYAEKICDRVVMINNGKKVLDGTLKEVKANYGQRVIHLAFNGNAAFIKDMAFVEKVRDSGNEMEIILKDLSYKNDFLKMISSKLDLNRFEVSEPSLQSIFISRVQEEE